MSAAPQVHPLWRPFELADVDQVSRLRVGAQPSHQSVHVVPYDPGWPATYDQVADRVRAALGDRVLELAHVGSTSVPGLAAKPVIDIDLVVADSADEESYVPPLEAAGFVLRIREPDWEEHRLLRSDVPATNLHVWSSGSPEPRRQAAFRDWLRADDEDRRAYGELKTALASRGFVDVMEYNNHKGALVYDIYERAFAADPDHPHDPHPRQP